MDDSLVPIKIKVIYKNGLKQITGKRFEEIIISKNLPFIMLLKMIFDSYPEISKEHPPGSIGLLINGNPPKEFDFLSEGDVVELMSFKF